MFTIKIHTVDFPRPFHATVTHSVNFKDNVRPTELRGVAHLFRQLPPKRATVASTVATVSARSTRIFVVAVPSYLSSDDFLIFCGAHVPYFEDILFLRNDAMEDRYSVLITLENQLAADGFYFSFNGKRFNSSEVEVCHLYFYQSVDHLDLAESSRKPPPGYTELPSCPVCLERLDPDTSGIQSTLCDHSVRCSCASKWTYLSCSVCRTCQQEDEKPVCAVCGTFKNLWICLICGFVGCGRYEEKHAIEHWSCTKHNFSLQLEEPQIWDYDGDRHVQRLHQSKGDRKSISVNSPWKSVKECVTCGVDEEGLRGAMFGSKTEAILDEYNHLLANQLDNQRQHYESLIADATARKESSSVNAVEKAIFSATHDLQCKIERYTDEKKAAVDRNRELMKTQESMQLEFREVEERKGSSLKSRDEKILDLKEQIRDLKVYIEAQKRLSESDPDGISGGTILSIESNQSSTKKRTKSGRRRN